MSGSGGGGGGEKKRGRERERDGERPEREKMIYEVAQMFSQENLKQLGRWSKRKDEGVKEEE